MTIVMQTKLTELNIPLKLNWKKGKSMPFRMSKSIQTVLIGDNVYVGGFHTSGDYFIATVMVYSLRARSWTNLPLCEMNYKHFGMAAMNNQLVLVGGYSIAGKVTNVLRVWDEGSQTWTCPFPGMPTSRASPSVTSYQNWLIVTGGVDQRGYFSDKVEILHIHSGQWYESPPLPHVCSHMSSAINGNMWYQSRGYSSEGLAPNKHVLSVCLDELISQGVSQSAGSVDTTSPLPWQTLTDPPLTHSTVLVLNGALLAVGGVWSSVIHLYQPSSRRWVKIGDLPTNRWQCACTVLPSGEIFVAGGCSDYHDSDCVDICSLK